MAEQTVIDLLAKAQQIAATTGEAVKDILSSLLLEIMDKRMLRGRIELLAESAWIEQLDAAAKAMGVSRSAYIRMACNRQMSSDRREGPPGN